MACHLMSYVDGMSVIYRWHLYACHVMGAQVMCESHAWESWRTGVGQQGLVVHGNMQQHHVIRCYHETLYDHTEYLLESGWQYPLSNKTFDNPMCRVAHGNMQQENVIYIYTCQLHAQMFVKVSLQQQNFVYNEVSGWWLWLVGSLKL